MGVDIYKPRCNDQSRGIVFAFGALIDMPDPRDAPVRNGYVCRTGFCAGSIDDVRIYNRVLSPQEIGQLYNIGR